MHIQDGILSTPVCLATGAIALGVVGYSLRKLKDSLADRTVPMTGMMAALIFAGQMINFPLGVVPVAGHLMGGVLAAVVVGPWAGCLAMTLVLLVQRFLFSDGGLLTLGANVLHMAVIGSIGGYMVYAAIRRWFRDARRGILVGSVLASWLSVMAAAALFCLEFRLSWSASEFRFGEILTLMVAYHSMIGIGEALITGFTVHFILAQRPDLIYSPQADPGITERLGKVVLAGLTCALAVGAFLAPFASTYDDGLEAVAARTGFDEREIERPGLFGDYDDVPLPEGAWQGWAVSLSGIIGTSAVFGIAWILGRTVRPRPALAEVSRE